MMQNPPVSGAEFICAALTCRKKESALASACGVSVNELHCLLQIYLEKPCCVHRLAELLGMKAPATSKVLRALDRRGYVVRSPEPSDRRRERVALTPQGEAAAVHALEVAERMLAASNEYPGEPALVAGEAMP